MVRATKRDSYLVRAFSIPSPPKTNMIPCVKAQMCSNIQPAPSQKVKNVCVGEIQVKVNIFGGSEPIPKKLNLHTKRNLSDLMASVFC